MGPLPTFPPSAHSDANTLFEKASQLKASGNPEEALTLFRRAVIIDPNFAAAQWEVGLLCRDKSRLDKMFNRYAFDAFRKAAQLSLDQAEVHDRYILVAGEQGALPHLIEEYAALAEKYPENEVIQRCRKNLTTLAMASMTDTGPIKDGNAGVRKALMVGSIMALLLGGVIMFSPIVLRRKGVGGEQSRGVARSGVAVIALSLVGFIVRTRF